MAVEDTGADPASRKGVQEIMREAIVELQSIKFAYAAGTTAATNITVTGIETDDTVLAAFSLTTSAVAVDMLSEVAVTAADTIQFSTTNPTGLQVVVVYVDTD
jgi:hypothetical protein